MAQNEKAFVIDDVLALEHKAEKEHGISVSDVSSWDSSESFQNHMAEALVLPPPSKPWDYYYTYSVSPEDRRQVLLNLGMPEAETETAMGLLLQSSTISIVHVINLLVRHNYRKLCILQPGYFSVESCCEALSMDYGLEQIMFSESKVSLPMERILSGEYDCVWITSPIFSAGYYFDESILSDIEKIREEGMALVFDESLALPGRELIRRFPVDKKLFAIYSPHKAISINGLKFSVIVCDKSYERFLEWWVDIFSGALGGSNRDAVYHFISPNFQNACVPAYEEYITLTGKVVDRVVAQFPFVSMLPDTAGHYLQIFTDLKIEGREELTGLLDQVINKEGASFIPSTLNGYDPGQGFGFRVNLTREAAELEQALTRILQYLENVYL